VYWWEMSPKCRHLVPVPGPWHGLAWHGIIRNTEETCKKSQHI